jgi:hypothetical protein
VDNDLLSAIKEINSRLDKLDSGLKDLLELVDNEKQINDKWTTAVTNIVQWCALAVLIVGGLNTLTHDNRVNSIADKAITAASKEVEVKTK